MTEGRGTYTAGGSWVHVFVFVYTHVFVCFFVSQGQGDNPVVGSWAERGMDNCSRPRRNKTTVTLGFSSMLTLNFQH